ncbi:MAG: Fur family transcriptional regulator [Opitutales bacterium]
MIASTQTNHPLAGVESGSASIPVLDQACGRLRAAGLRITQPRIAILSALMRQSQPASIEQIHGKMPDASCDLVTVYRCLAAFEEIGLVRRSFFHNGTSLYEIGLGDTKHYHVVCKGTNRMEEIDAESVAELRETLARIETRLQARGFHGLTHVVEFFASESATDRSQSKMPVV